MPLTKKGAKIRQAMEKFYGKKEGDAVFYASENKGNISGVTKKKKKHVESKEKYPGEKTETRKEEEME
jgi:CMP-N-acetylneuraminic acid synthetase